MMQFSRSGTTRVGDRVRVRGQRWLVTEVSPHGSCSVVTLSGLGPRNLSVERRVLTPFDLVEPLRATRRCRVVGGRWWRRACRELIADAGPAGILRTARSARIDLMPHQLEPALAVVRGLGSRVLIADEVGLGKTVQAALVVAELKARGAATRVLVLTPAGLREQWVEEFASRFDLTLTLFDLPGVRGHRASLPVGVNPWSIADSVVTSVDFIKRPEVLPAVSACRWDVVVVDEAHHATSDTDRHKAVAILCGLASYVLLLSATPHSGDPTAFGSLRAIGQRDDRLLLFRRTRRDIGPLQDRRIHQLRIKPSGAERRMHAALAEFARAVRRECTLPARETSLALATLRKRALSSAFALQHSVERRLLGLAHGSELSAQQLPLPLADAAGELDDADDTPRWTIPALRDSAQERILLMRVAEAAEAAARHETKFSALRRLLRRVSEPAIVFTEYRDTLLRLRDCVTPQAAIVHGGLSRDERRASLRLFGRGGVLLATDAAGEGLNLHHRCRLIINLELPWNPMRLEQRIGRVDRIGQHRRVHVFHLIAGGTNELQVLSRLKVRIARAQMEAGAPDPLSSVRATADHVAPAPKHPRLEGAAMAEHQRLRLSRQIGEQSSPAEAGRSVRYLANPLIHFSKRWRLRTELRGRILVVLQSYASDETGRVIASHLTAVLLRAAPDIRRSLEMIDPLDLVPGDREREKWIRETHDTHEAFWAERHAREMAIARAIERGHDREIQPALFDLRAEQLLLMKEEQLREELRESHRRVVAAARARVLSIHPPRTALVLLP